MKLAPERRGAHGWTVWTPVCVAALCLALVPGLGLVSPRSRIAAEPPSVSTASLQHEPPPSPLVAPRPPERVALAPHSVSAGESAHMAEDVEAEPQAPRSASTAHAPLARLELRVSAAGRGAPRAWVELLHEGADGSSRVRVERADEDGRLALELAPGTLRAAAWSAEATALPQQATLVAERTEHVELTLEPAFPVEGRVLDASSGAPIAGAEVAFWTFAESDRVYTDAQGRFRHPRFPARAPAQQLAAKAVGYGRSVRYLRIQENGWKLSAANEGEASLRGSGTPFLELVLVPELRLRGRVLDADGTPLAGARVAAEGFFHALPSVAARDAGETRSAVDGTFALVGLRSDIGHSLVVEADERAALVRELAASMGELGLGELDLGDLVLTSATVLAGAVFDADGWPVAGVEIVLQLEEDPPVTRAGSALDVGARIEAREWRTRSDEHGAFVFERLAARPVRLEAAAGGATWSGEVWPGADGSFPATSIALAPRVATLAGGPPVQR
ncbi:MAG: carboxypeptidase regulatory-like domain-containing protein [Planctomycetes bacterium]|nr:carboxypeptidase regulatory-like domain-containing protein [Planctomycetota bacterium]